MGNEIELEQRVDRETNYFLKGVSSYGSADLDAAIRKMLVLGEYGSDLTDLVNQQANDLDVDIKDVDVVGVVFDHMVQEARNKIDEILDFDIMNDIEVIIYYDLMCSSIELGDEDKKLLEEKFKEATQEQLDELKDNAYVKEFLDDVDIKLPEQAAKEVFA